MVACPHAAGSEAGVEMLKDGGSAVDAAIAASALLSVVYPHMTSIGGDQFWLIWDARRRAVRFLNAGGRAAASGTLEWFGGRGLREIPMRGILPATLTTPGAVDGWCEAHAALGRLSLARDLAPAIACARDGFAVTDRLATWTSTVTALLAGNAEAAAIFLPDGEAPRRGQRLVNPDLALTLERIGAHGRRGFYEGETAREMARFSREHGGFFTEDDLGEQRARWGEPVSTTYRGVTIYEPPPPTQGISVLEMLNLIEPYDLSRLDRLGPDAIHLLVQAKQIAFHDRDRHIADPDFFKVPVARLVSKAYADERRALLDRSRALPWDRVPSHGSLEGDTVAVCAVDGDGNAAALIHSVYGTYGAGVVAGRTGVVLQNRSAYFSLDPTHPNRLEPRKIPLHTLIASLAFKGDALWQVLGCMGADGQPQIHLQAYTAMIDYGLDVQEAVAGPRWLAGRFALGDPRDLLNMEARFPAATITELERRGHLVHRWPAWEERAGHAHGITIDPATGTRIGGADPRSDGAAIGY
jgi:gamma-glutamyltranspeptidase/glutathione hydrolase